MSKTDTIRALALDAGLPDAVTVTYHRAARKWFVEYPVALGTDATLRHRTTIVGSYESVQDAQERLPGDAQGFYSSYGRVLRMLAGDMSELTALERDLLQTAPITAPAGTFAQLANEGIITARRKLASADYIHELTPLGERLASMLTGRHTPIEERDTPPIAETRHDAISERDALHTLLDRVEQGQPVDAALIAAARAHLDALERGVKHEATTYASQYPTLPKAPIRWQQPTNRKAPVYAHEFNCAVCGRSVSTQTHSPHAPATCGRDECDKEHRRAQARERKRRQRARRKVSQSDKGA